MTSDNKKERGTRIRTRRLRLRVASREEMEQRIAGQTDPELTDAYREMLQGCLDHPEAWDWYAVWRIERENGALAGDLSFKGPPVDGAVEIGYGIDEAFRRNGYATEAVEAAVVWALSRDGVTRVEAETEPGNRASQRVLEKCGFIPTGKNGEEGPRFMRIKRRNDMEFHVLSNEEKDALRETMLSMMEYSDREFVPPLSSRTSTTQKQLSGIAATGDVTAYFNTMFGQEIIGAFEDGELIAYLSYRLDYTNEVIKGDVLPNVYLSTLVTKPAARGKGLTFRLYSHLFNVIYPDRSIYTRTWSTNAPHIHILLDKFTFREIARFRDDRGPGIDTTYYEMKRP